ncbi:MAG: putative manganese efflux pump MntP [Syntrophaceae bacterium PtaU1.Bin231]|jgi:putative Mn2+ efflux pump MntP|nr:MAG: putative manganese efflux pump MntP [Syntrophaceae bacterium PtaU1.Bin231]
MDFASILLIAIGLGVDALSVAVAAGVALGRPSGAAVFRMSFAFGFFQFAMPLVGWSAGRTISRFIESFDHWVAFGLLLVVGGRMIVEAFRDEGARNAPAADPTRGWTLLMLAVATSIDALAVGLSLALVGEAIVLPSVVIGVTAFAMTWAGMVFGGRIGAWLGRKVEIAGGLILIGIGVKILFDHL